MLSLLYAEYIYKLILIHSHALNFFRTVLLFYSFIILCCFSYVCYVHLSMLPQQFPSEEKGVVSSLIFSFFILSLSGLWFLSLDILYVRCKINITSQRFTLILIITFSVVADVFWYGAKPFPQLAFYSSELSHHHKVNEKYECDFLLSLSYSLLSRLIHSGCELTQSDYRVGNEPHFSHQ